MLRVESSSIEMSQISDIESVWSYLKNAEKEEVVGLYNYNLENCRFLNQSV
jgi:hypothetical protein